MSERVTTAGHHAPKLRAFLAAIQVCPNITRAAKAAGISASLHHRRYKVDRVYRAVFEMAWAEGVQSLEDLATDRAMFGWEEPVVYKGDISTYQDLATGEIKPVTITKIDNGLLQFMLRGAKPEKYRERHQVEHTGSVDIVQRLQAGRKRAAERNKNDGGSGSSE